MVVEERDSPKTWAEIWRDDFIHALGVDQVVLSALAPEIKYSLFVEAPTKIIQMADENRHKPYSFPVYMALACFEGLKSVATGNNPIGALMVV